MKTFREKVQIEGKKMSKTKSWGTPTSKRPLKEAELAKILRSCQNNKRIIRMYS